jgi:hypothetical protein
MENSNPLTRLEIRKALSEQSRFIAGLGQRKCNEQYVLWADETYSELLDLQRQERTGTGQYSTSQ